MQPKDARDQAKGLRPRERRIAAVFAGIVAVLLALWFFWPRPKWAVALQAEEATATPWQSVVMTATITPEAAPKKPLKWTWRTDGKSFDATGPRVEWRSGVQGSHVIEVTATAADGTFHLASVRVEVRAVPFIGVDGTIVTPDPIADTDAGAPVLPFGIADIWVEKSEVCEGEPTRIRVTPFDTRGTTGWLRPNVNNESSWEASYISPMLAAGTRRVLVSVSDPHLGDATAPPTVQSEVFIHVKECVAPYPIFLSSRPIPPDDNHFAFNVVLFDGPKWEARIKGPPVDDPSNMEAVKARAKSFRWDFGDKYTITTKRPRASHRYPDVADRPNERATSYEIKVEALDEGGQVMATAYTQVTLLNTIRLLARDLKTVQLVATVPPGLAPTADDGSRKVDVTLRNLHPVETATLDTMTARYVRCVTVPGESDVKESWPLADSFPDRSVGPGNRSVSGHVAVPATGLDGVCSVHVELSGTTTPSNLHATASFSVDLSANEPNVRHLSKRELELYKKAKSLLPDASVVTLEDVQELEDEGKIPRNVLTPDPYGKGDYYGAPPPRTPGPRRPPSLRSGDTP